MAKSIIKMHQSASKHVKQAGIGWWLSLLKYPNEQ